MDGYVASPELLFLELAPELGFLRTVLLGLELCGHGVGGKTQALTTAARIQRFVARCKGHAGQELAARAAKFVADGSASIMESLLFMVLTLPHRYGGFGLAGARFNAPVQLPPAIEASFGQSKLVVDLFWEQGNKKIALEYDSYEHHAKTDSWIRDSRRIAILESLKINAFSINTAQLYSSSATTEIAQVIASQLGKRIRVRNTTFATRHKELRSMLPRKTQ
jgi:hypothetical protein